MGVLCTWVKLNICRFWAVNCTKMLVWRLCPDSGPTGGALAPPDPLAVIRVKGRVGNREGRKGREDKEMENAEGEERVVNGDGGLDLNIIRSRGPSSS